MTPATRPRRIDTESMTGQQVQLDTICDLEVVRRRLDGFLVYLRADVDAVAGDSGPRDTLENRPDVALVASGPSRLRFGTWAVQVQLTAGHGGTSITLRALGHDAASASPATAGSRSSISLARSVRRLRILTRLLRVMEEEAQMQRLDHP
ncbi:MAG: hypothetical protein MOP51_305 [Citricoccus sp.]|nr:hypothetical protein [Citricoccus sp. WCRC_4]